MELHAWLNKGIYRAAAEIFLIRIQLKLFFFFYLKNVFYNRIQQHDGLLIVTRLLNVCLDFKSDVITFI